LIFHLLYLFVFNANKLSTTGSEKNISKISYDHFWRPFYLKVLIIMAQGKEIIMIKNIFT